MLRGWHSTTMTSWDPIHTSSENLLCLPTWLTPFLSKLHRPLISRGALWLFSRKPFLIIQSVNEKIWFSFFVLIPGSLEGIARLSDSTLCLSSAPDSLFDWNAASFEGITLAVQSPDHNSALKEFSRFWFCIWAKLCGICLFQPGSFYFV